MRGLSATAKLLPGNRQKCKKNCFAHNFMRDAMHSADVLSQDVRVSVRLSHASIVSQRLNAEQIKLFQLNHRL